MMERVMNEEQFAWWLVGLVDGEGYFGVSRYTKASGAGPYYRCVFRVSMAARDADLLRMAQARTGWGKVYEYASGRIRLDGAPTQDVVIWTVNSKQVGEVAAFFRHHRLQSNKAREFAVWEEAARAHARRQRTGRGHSDVDANAILVRCYDELRALRGAS